MNTPREKQIERNFRKKRSSLAPAAIGAVLILIVIGIYFSRNFLFRSETESSETENQEQQEDESLDIEMILPKEIPFMIRNEKYQIVDIRNNGTYNNSHIEASDNIPLENIEEKLNLFERNKTIIIVEEFETRKGKELVSRLEKMGLEARYLAGGISKYEEEGYSLVSYGDPKSTKDLVKVNPLTLEEFKEAISGNLETTALIDVRPRKQYEQDHLQRTINIPFEELEKRKSEIPVSRIIIIDEDPERSFRAGAVLYDMNIFSVRSLTVSYSELKKELERAYEEDQEESAGDENQ